MDLTTIIITIFTIADELIKLCKEVKQCQREAVRIELRVHNLVGTLESAAGAFCGDIAFEKKLLKLRKFMNTLSPLLEKANYCTNMMDKAKQMANVSTLAKALQREEAILSAMCDDLGLAMLPSIAEKLNELPDKLEARVSVAMEAYFSVALQAAMQEQEDKTEKMLRRTISAYVRQLLVENDSSHTEGTCRGTTSGTGENISKTTSRPGHNGGSSRGVVGSGDTVGAGGGVPFCKGHNRKCVLRTVRKKCENHGRQFYRCGISGGDQCKTYIWLNETAGQYSGGGGSGGRSDSCDGDRGENQDRPMCEGHEEPCAFRTVRKEGANRGRHFYNCARHYGEKCQTFIWTDENKVTSSGGRDFDGGGFSAKREQQPQRAGKYVPLCTGHSEACVVLTVRKEGETQGQKYYKCPRPRKQQCDTFEWVN